MTSYKVEERAGYRIDEIYSYTRDVWGETKAKHYVRGLFDRFEAIAARRVPWRPIPAAFEVEGYFCRYEQHFIYWRLLADGCVGIVTVLHSRMHQIERFHEDFWT